MRRMSLRHADSSTDAPPGATTWVDLHVDALYRSARRRVTTEHEAQDIVQETLVAAWKTWKKSPGAPLPDGAWLMGVLKHKVADHYRRVFRERGIGRADTTETAVQFDDDGHWSAASSPKKWKEPSVGDDRGLFEIRETLDNCLAKLPPAHARVFLLRESEAMETEEVLRLTGLSESNLFVMLHRARASLRACLEKNHFTARGAVR